MNKSFIPGVFRIPYVYFTHLYIWLCNKCKDIVWLIFLLFIHFMSHFYITFKIYNNIKFPNTGSLWITYQVCLKIILKHQNIGIHKYLFLQHIAFQLLFLRLSLIHYEWKNRHINVCEQIFLNKFVYLDQFWCLAIIKAYVFHDSLHFKTERLIIVKGLASHVNATLV